MYLHFGSWVLLITMQLIYFIWRAKVALFKLARLQSLVCKEGLFLWNDGDVIGVAFTSLQGLELYPMVCSTAAQSGMRVTYAVSQPVDLKLLSLQALRSDGYMMCKLALVPGLRTFIASTWWIGSGKSNALLCPIFMGPQSRGASLQISYLNKMIKTIQRSWALNISTWNPKSGALATQPRVDKL